jgi:hypothetical protein
MVRMSVAIRAPGLLLAKGKLRKMVIEAFGKQWS